MIHHRKDFTKRGPKIKRLFAIASAHFVALLLGLAASAQVRLVVDQVGYEVTSTKQAFAVMDKAQSVGDAPSAFILVDDASGKSVLQGTFKSAGSVDRWGGRVFWLADFSAWRKTGQYHLEARTKSGSVTTCAFSIEHDMLERSTLSNVIFYFKGQRATGDFDQADRHLQLPDKSGYVDLRGGWYDATGDYGIHLSHQNPTAYFNPQQVPLVAWTLLQSYQLLLARKDDDFSEYERRLLDEGLYGADFLVRLKRPGGSFLQTISAPGREKLAKDRVIGNPNTRTQIKKNASDSTEHSGDVDGPHAYEASYRSGGGMAIAALALASTMPLNGEISRADYLKTAEDAFAFLEEHNKELVSDGKENILDDYCALMAATYLYRADHRADYLAAADKRAGNLMSRLMTTGDHPGSWRADETSRPFFHPSDAGLPIVSLIEYSTIASPSRRNLVRETIAQSLRFELSTTGEVNNPFGYARQLVRMGNGTVRTAFFFPHDTEAAPWWQGENARLGSLAAAARLAAPMFDQDPAFQKQLQDYAWNQLHWILGRNPFDACMLMGSGHGNAPYMFFRSYKYTSAPGAIINGITAARDDEDGIAFNEGFAVTGLDEDWRWTEEWLPHAAWYLYAVSLPHN